MASLNDIPFVGTVINRIENTTVDAGILRLRYLLRYKSLVKLLKIQFDKLKIEEDAISRKVVAERNDGKTIKEHVLKWQQDVQDIKEIVETLLERYEQRPSWMCFKDIQFAEPVSRFRLGKQAAKDAITVTELTNSGKEYRANEIAYHPPNENLPISDTTYQNFQSREEAYGKLWDALANEDGYPILGIYGMPGVGKTRMMEEAWKEAKEKGIFSKVTRASVGGEREKIDVLKIQHELAGHLGCRLKSKDDEGQRAFQLKNSLMNGGKTLVILDDVWDVILLNKIGIPFGDGRSKGCKILFTSRSQKVCLQNKCEGPIEIKTLTEGEALDMFEKAVGTSKMESLQDSVLVERVCKKCGRLPLLINAVGKALKFATENSWNEALYQLENCRYKEIDGMDPLVYTCLLLSFKKLTEAGKTCLLLCSLFGEDANINIERLSNLATGSQLLGRQSNIAGVVDILKSSSMILQGEYSGTVKLHDVIRNVARSIATKDPKYAFLSIRCKLEMSDSTDYRTRRLLHLDMDDNNVCFPSDLVCPDLDTFWLQGNYNRQRLSSGFSEGLTNLSFLFQNMIFPEQQFSIHATEKLRMIIIDRCTIHETFFSCVSQNLETLCIKDGYLPRQLDLSKLKNLRKLEILHPITISMVPEAISNLSRLEELKIPRGFVIKEDVDATSMYVELNKLTRLRKLIICLPYSQSYLDGDIMSNLVEFKISVGEMYSKDEYFPEKSIKFTGKYIQSGWMALVKKAEQVSLEGKDLNQEATLPGTLYLVGVECLFEDRKHIEAFANVKKLEITSCYMDHLIRLPLDGKNQLLPYFFNLCFLKINSCLGLKYLFPARIAKCLLKIQQLEVYNCRAVEEIVRVCYGPTDDGEAIISFPKLKRLHMADMSSLKSFCTHKVVFRSLEEMTIIRLDSAVEIFGKDVYNQEDSSSFSQLKVLKVKRCNKLENVIPVTMDHEFNNLGKVSIKYCRKLKTVFQLSSIGTDVENLNQIDGRRVVFSSLKKLHLDNLPNIKSFWSYDREIVEVDSYQTKVSFPNMSNIKVWGCKISGLTEEIELGRDDESPSKLIRLTLKLTLTNCLWHVRSLIPLASKRITEIRINHCQSGPTLFRSFFFRCFQQLQVLSVGNCSLLEEIVEEDIEMDNEKTISLPCLHSLYLFKLPSLKSFSGSSMHAFNMPALKLATLSRCPRMDKFTSLPIKTPLLRMFNDRPILEEDTSDLNSYVSQELYRKD